jgi:hypothetical protein
MSTALSKNLGFSPSRDPHLNIMSNDTIGRIKYVVIFTSVIVGLAIVTYCADFVFAYVLRDLYGITMGFPTSYRVPTKARNNPELKWFRLGTIRAGGVVTNTMVSAACENGFVFEMRSFIGFRLMNTVLVPWSAVLLEETKDGAFNGNLTKLYIMDDNNFIINTIELGTSDARWLAYVTRRAERLPPIPPKHR